MWNHWLFMFFRVASLVRARGPPRPAGAAGGRSRESGRSRGGAAWAPRSWECCRFHVRWFFPGDRRNSTNEATKRRAGRRARPAAPVRNACICGTHDANEGNTGSCGVLSQQLVCWFRSTRKLPVDSACPRSHTLSFSGGRPRGKSCRMRRRCQRLTTSWLMTIPTPSE